MGVICVVCGGRGGRCGDVGLGENPEPGGAGGSARQPEPEAPGIAGRSSIPRPAPRSRAPPSALRARSPPFPFRVCVGVRRSGGRARGRAGRRGGARGSARGGGRGPGARPRPRLARRSGRRRPGRCQSEGTAGGRRCSPVSPARRHPVLPRSPQPRRGWGRGAASPGEKARGGERSSFAGWAAEEQEKKLFPPAPRARSLARVSPPGGWELHLRPGARGQGWTSGSRGEGCGVTCTGVPFAIGLLAASGQAGEGAPAPPARLPPQTVAGRSAACSFCGGCDPGRGPRHRGLPLRPPPSKHTLTHTHTLWRPSCHRSPQAWGGGAESPLRGGRRGVNPPNFPAPQAAAAAAREIGSPERARRLRPGRRRRWGRAGARVPLCAIWLRRLVSSCRVTTLRLYCSTHRQ